MSNKEFSRLTKRQIKMIYGDQTIDVQTRKLMELVDASYAHYENDRQLLERSIEISSKEFSKINNQLKSANEFLDSFNYGVAHDLKMHATNVLSMVEMLKKYLQKDDKITIEKIVGNLEVSADSFLSTIKAFLYIAQIEATMNNKAESFLATELVSLVLTELNYLCEINNAQIVKEINVNEIYYPKHHLKTILTNLVSNAIKYSKVNEQPRVTIALNESKGLYILSVQDEGIGIDIESSKEKLFKVFSRIENFKDVEGTGVGLFMVKKIIEKLGGTIKVESKLNIGTKFIVTLKKAE